MQPHWMPTKEKSSCHELSLALRFDVVRWLPRYPCQLTRLRLHHTIKKDIRWFPVTEFSVLIFCFEALWPLRIKQKILATVAGFRQLHAFYCVAAATAFKTLLLSFAWAISNATNHSAAWKCDDSAIIWNVCRKLLLWNSSSVWLH